MVIEVPFFLELYDGMVGGPASHRLHEGTLVGKRTVGALACGVSKQVRIAGRVGKIVDVIVFVHRLSRARPVHVNLIILFSVFLVIFGDLLVLMLRFNQFRYSLGRLPYDQLVVKKNGIGGADSQPSVEVIDQALGRNFSHFLPGVPDRR